MIGDHMTRWVERDGLTVRFGNVVGPFVGRAYAYRFPTAAKARAFERRVRKVTADGLPAAVGRRWWRFETRPAARSSP